MAKDADFNNWMHERAIIDYGKCRPKFDFTNHELNFAKIRRSNVYMSF